MGMEFKAIGRYSDGRTIYSVRGDVPAYGYIAIGVIDRGTNVLQVRPTTICPQNCVFCSVDAGIKSSNRWAEYIVEPDIIVRGIEEATVVKGHGVEALIDTIGDALTYPYLVELVYMLKKIPGVSSVAIETHGALLSKQLIDRLNEAGLDRINLSIDTLNSEKAKMLYGIPYYDLGRVVKLAEYIVKETNIDLHVTPLWLPGLNDEDVENVVKWALRIGAGKKWPPVTIQKPIKHKYGRWPSGVRKVSWSEFWNWLERLERKLGTRLKWNMDEWGMRYSKRINIGYRIGDVVAVNIVARGWVKGEYLGVTKANPPRLIGLSIFGKKPSFNETLYAKITSVYDSIVLGRILS
ncbi:MAG: radical SAM protein [Desulfurococcaceae archaeon]